VYSARSPNIGLLEVILQKGVKQIIKVLLLKQINKLIHYKSDIHVFMPFRLYVLIYPELEFLHSLPSGEGNINLLSVLISHQRMNTGNIFSYQNIIQRRNVGAEIAQSV
jgi:hypothetical protein